MPIDYYDKSGAHVTVLALYKMTNFSSLNNSQHNASIDLKFGSWREKTKTKIMFKNELDWISKFFFYELLSVFTIKETYR